ncbi:MAG: SHOCT domain-containing protein [Ardenticatenales bacterium]|nr:SHOCT domain-containing protein [Ardenticatenales bacterium]
MDVVTKLERLNELHRSGALTADEFGAAKAAILAGRPSAEAVLDGGVGDPGSGSAPRHVGSGYDRAPEQMRAYEASARSGRKIASLVCLIIGAFWILFALAGAKQARSFIDAMPAAPSWAGMPGTFGDMTITDASGQPIQVSPPESIDQPIRRSMKAGISQTAGLNVLIGLVFVVAGVWLGLGGRRQPASVEAG